MNMNLNKQPLELKSHQAYTLDAQNQWYDERMDSIISDLKMNPTIISHKKGSAEELYDNFIKFIAQNLKNKRYFSDNMIETIRASIVEYPSLDIIDILVKELLKLRSNLSAEITNDYNNSYFSIAELVAILRNETGNYGQFKGILLFENNIITKINAETSRLDTLTKKIKDNLTTKAQEYLAKYNLTIENVPELKLFLESSDSIWTATYSSNLNGSFPVRMGNIIHDKLMEIGVDATDYSEIVGPTFINKLFDEMKSNIQLRVLDIIKNDIDSNAFISTFKQDQIFNQNKVLKKELKPETFINNLNEILKKFNLTDENIRFINFQILNEDDQPLKISDAIGYLNAHLELQLDGEWREISLYENKKIVISVESMKRLFDYMSEKSIAIGERTIIASKLPDILSGIDLKTLFENSNYVSFDDISLDQLLKLFNLKNNILTQSELENLFRGLPTSDQISLNDLDFKFKITLHQDPEKPLWDSVRISINRFTITNKENNNVDPKYKTIDIDTSIFRDQSNTNISSLPAIFKNKLDAMEDKILSNKVEYIFRKSLENYSFLLHSTPEEWITNWITTWGEKGLNDFINTSLDVANNLNRYKFHFRHQESSVSSISSYIWSFEIEDTLLGETYKITDINVPIVDAEKILKQKQVDLVDFYRLNFEEINKLADKEEISLEKALTLFLPKKFTNQINENNIVLNLPSGEQVIPVIKYVKRMENGIEVSKIEFIYEYTYPDFNESTQSTKIATFKIEIDATAKPITIDQLENGKKELDTKADEAYQDLKSQFPYNSDIDKDGFIKIIDEFYSKAKADFDKGILMEEDFNARLEEAKQDINELKEKISQELELGVDYLAILNRIFNGKIPPVVLKWVQQNPGKIIQMINLDLSDETIRELLKNAWIRDLFKETGILDMSLIKKTLKTMEHVRENYGYAYFGAGVGLGAAGLLSGLAAVATLKASKRSKKLNNAKSTIKSSKLIISTTTVLSLLLLLGSTCLMLWFFITKGGSF